MKSELQQHLDELRSLPQFRDVDCRTAYLQLWTFEGRRSAVATGIPIGGKPGPPYRVLSLDGGGLRGLLTTLLLERICRAPGMARAFDNVDLIAGNSSGALIAIALAHGLRQKSLLDTISVLRGLFENAPDLFGPRRPLYRGPKWLSARYGNEAAERHVGKLLGDTTLRDLSRRVLITTFDLDNDDLDPEKRRWKPKIFHNLPGPESDRHESAKEVALYSSAAPTYFPSVGGFVDGAVYANNPTMCALAQVYDGRYEPRPKPSIQDVMVFAVGAGENLRYQPGEHHDWGNLQWVHRVVDLLTDGVAGIADYQARQMLGDANYKRLAPVFPAGTCIDIDQVSALPFLKAFIDDPKRVQPFVDDAIDWLRKHWMAAPAGWARQRATIAAPPPPRLLEATSKHVGNATELTCLFPLRPGFVPVLETRTYATRLRILFKVLQGLRAAAREINTLHAVLDTVDAIRSIHSFTVTVIAERFVFLSVVFDRPWESVRPDHLAGARPDHRRHPVQLRGLPAAPQLRKRVRTVCQLSAAAPDRAGVLLRLVVAHRRRLSVFERTRATAPQRRFGSRSGAADARRSGGSHGGCGRAGSGRGRASMVCCPPGVVRAAQSISRGPRQERRDPAQGGLFAAGAIGAGEHFSAEPDCLRGALAVAAPAGSRAGAR